MKFKLTLLFIFFVSCLMLTSCRRKETVLLKLSLPKGYTVKVTETTSGEQKSSKDDGTIFSSKTIIHNEYKLECLAVEPNGIMTIRKTWLATMSKMDQGMNEKWTTMMDFDSRDESKEQKRFYLKPVIGKSVTLKVNTEGKILSCTGNEELALKIVETDTNHAKYSEETKTMRLKGFSNSLKHLPGILAPYPDKPIVPDKSWRQPWGRCEGSACVLYTWTLKKVENYLAEIEVKAVDLPMPQQQDSQIKSDMKQNTDIDLRVDITTGLIKSYQGQMKMAGNVTSPERGADEVDVKKYEMTGESTFTIETFAL